MGQLQQYFVSRLQTNIGNFMVIAQDVKNSIDVATARQYAQQWTDADLSDVIVDGKAITKAELIALVGVVDDVIAFLNNQPVATQDRATVFNKYRNDI